MGHMVYGSNELAGSFRTVRKNTIAIAEDIPADKYSFRAAPDAMSIAEQLAHIAVSTRWQETLHGEGMSAVDFSQFAERMAKTKADEKALADKDQIVKALKEDGERFATFLAGLTAQQLDEMVSFPPPISPSQKSRFEMLLGVKEHEMHHRGQLMLMQRMIGIVPHVTRQREAMRAQAQQARA